MVSVRAPHRIGPGAYRWFDTDLTASEPKIDGQEKATSRAALVAFLNSLAEHSPGGLYLMGFSQGGIMALSLALTPPRQIAGCAVAGARILPEVASAIDPKEVMNASLFVAHGLDDPVLPIRHGRATRVTLNRICHDFSYREYGAGHELTPAMVGDISAWLSIRLDRLSPASGCRQTEHASPAMPAGRTS